MGYRAKPGHPADTGQRQGRLEFELPSPCGRGWRRGAGSRGKRWLAALHHPLPQGEVSFLLPPSSFLLRRRFSVTQSTASASRLAEEGVRGAAMALLALDVGFDARDLLAQLADVLAQFLDAERVEHQLL